MPVWLNLIVFPWGWVAIVAALTFLLIQAFYKALFTDGVINDEVIKFKQYWKSLTFYLVAIIAVFWAAQALDQYRPKSTIENPAQNTIDQRERELDAFEAPGETPVPTKLDILIDEDIEKRDEKRKSIKDAFKDLPNTSDTTQPVGGALPSEGLK